MRIALSVCLCPLWTKSNGPLRIAAARVRVRVCVCWLTLELLGGYGCSRAAGLRRVKAADQDVVRQAVERPERPAGPIGRVRVRQVLRHNT